jgi:hypothetical protein
VQWQSIEDTWLCRLSSRSAQSRMDKEVAEPERLVRQRLPDLPGPKRLFCEWLRMNLSMRVDLHPNFAGESRSRSQEEHV